MDGISSKFRKYGKRNTFCPPYHVGEKDRKGREGDRPIFPPFNLIIFFPPHIVDRKGDRPERGGSPKIFVPLLMQFLIMVAALGDGEDIVFDFVDQAVNVVDSPRPITG